MFLSRSLCLSLSHIYIYKHILIVWLYYACRFFVAASNWLYTSTDWKSNGRINFSCHFDGCLEMSWVPLPFLLVTVNDFCVCGLGPDMSSWLLILYCYISPIFSWLHHHIHYIGSLFVNPQGLASCLVTAKAIPQHSCSFSYASIKASLAATVEIRWRGSHGFTVPLFRFKRGA